MLTAAQLTDIARARLKDAGTLLSRRRYDGCVYLSGYAVETALKARITRTLKWAGFPETTGEWKGLSSLKTHDLNILLSFTTRGPRLIARHHAEWSVMLTWEPEWRYKPAGTATQTLARSMFESARTIARALL